jgi:hypothetical protein
MKTTRWMMAALPAVSLCLSCSGTSAPDAASEEPDIGATTSALLTGVPVSFRVEVSKFCLTVVGTNVVQSPCANTLNQKWYLYNQYRLANGNRVYEVRPAHAPTMCLDVANASTANGANVQIYTCASGGTAPLPGYTSATNQLWVMPWTSGSPSVDVAYNHIASYHTYGANSKCLDVAMDCDMSDGCNVNQYQCQPTVLYDQNQHWLATTPLTSRNDFDRNASTDILWHNGATGATGVWYMDGVWFTGRTENINENLGMKDSSGMRIVATNDFNDDGNTDILWHSNGSEGEFVMWYLNGMSLLTGPIKLDAGLNIPDSTGWRVVGSSDFNADGHADILWHHTSGVLGVWYMDGWLRRLDGRNLEGDPPSEPAGNGWSVVGTNDFDGNGTPDILWHHTSGVLGVWFMDGIVYRDSTLLLGSPPLEPAGNGWSVVGTGDYDHDGKADILWLNTDGTVGIWFMDGPTYRYADNLHGSYPIADTSVWSVVSK